MGFADVIDRGNTRPPQGIFEISVDQKADLGYKLKFLDGREYVYVKAAAAFTVGQQVQAPVVDATYDNSMAIQTAVKADDREIKVTVHQTHASFAANAYAGGFLIIETGTELGLCRMIKSNTAFVTGAAATVTFKFRDKVGVAVAIAGHTVGIVKCPYNGVIVNAGTAKYLGGAPVDVTILYYFWLQTRGVGPAVSTAATTAVNTVLVANGAAVVARNGDTQCVAGIALAAGVASEAVLIYYKVE
jgi:hypothetical protein